MSKLHSDRFNNLRSTTPSSTHSTDHSTDRLVSGNLALEDENPHQNLRPQHLREFIGQHKIINNLQVFVAAACKRKQAIDHVLFYGPPGLGKTTLAQIVAREMGVNFKATAGPVINKAGDLAALLTNLQTNDVLFIDEIHRLNTSVEEVLYSAMEDFKLDLMIGEGPAARSIRIDLPPFTLIGATTRSGLISDPLLHRFGIPLRLEFYNTEELQRVITRAASILSLEMAADASHELAKRARGTPRIAIRLLRRIKDFADVAGKQIIDRVLADEVLWRLEVDSSGLDGMDRRYLQSIADFYDGGPVGVETLAAMLAEQRDTIEDVVEPYLIQQGFVQRTPRGRVLTALAYDHLAKNRK